MLEILKRILGGQHQFASDGLLLMLVGGLGVYLRAIPIKLWWWIVGQTTMSLTVEDEDDGFVWVKEWFLMQDFVRRIRRIHLDTSLRNERAGLIPARGLHWFWHSGRPFTVTFYRNEETHGTRRREQITFVTVGRRQEFLRQFVAEIVECHVRNFTQRSSLYIYNEYWTALRSYMPRLLHSVVLRPGEKEKLISDVERFKRDRTRYYRLGVPYHRGYLFYGPPGTGKTSMVSALAMHFGMSIYLINLTEFNDKSLAHAVNHVSPGSIILFEDIDCMKSGRTRAHRDSSEVLEFGSPAKDLSANGEGREVTLSGLLNVLDGFQAPDNVLFMMTSNHIEALDPALLRPGRIDYKLYFGNVADEQKIELYQRFFPNASTAEAKSFMLKHQSVKTMAEFQGLLLRADAHHQSPIESIVLRLSDDESVPSDPANKAFSDETIAGD
jgi:chaperone BCS1